MGKGWLFGLFWQNILIVFNAALSPIPLVLIKHSSICFLETVVNIKKKKKYFFLHRIPQQTGIWYSQISEEKLCPNVCTLEVWSHLVSRPSNQKQTQISGSWSWRQDCHDHGPMACEGKEEHLWTCSVFCVWPEKFAWAGAAGYGLGHLELKTDECLITTGRHHSWTAVVAWLQVF